MTRGRISREGVLEVYRSGLGAASGWHKQECPYCGDDCGVHCPLVGAPFRERLPHTITICQHTVLEYVEEDGWGNQG